MRPRGVLLSQEEKTNNEMIPAIDTKNVNPIKELGDASKVRKAQSAFNMASLDLYRLHVLLSDCNDFSLGGSFIQWKRRIDCLDRELYPHQEKTERTDIGKHVVLTVKSMKEWNNSMRTKKPMSKVEELADDVYTNLHWYEIKERAVMKRLGINLPTRGTRSALSGGD